MKINKVKIKNAEGRFEEHEIGVDANNIHFSTTENAEQVIAAQNNNTSELDLQYQILEKEYNTSTPIEDYNLVRNIDEFEARPYDDTISKIKVAKIKKSDGSWGDGIELEVKSTGVALNNNKDAEAEVMMLKSKVAALENIEKTLTSKISQQTEEGKNLSIIGIDEDKDYNFKILGESKQEQYEGYNLLDCDLESKIINGIEIKKNANGSYTLNGTATVNTNIVWANKPFTLESGTYYIGLLEKVSNFNLYLALSATKFDILGQPARQNYFTRTLTETQNYVSLSSYIGSGQTINNLTLYPMISKDESKMSIETFEPYAGEQPSPNPEYPQDIEVVDNGWNLFDINKLKQGAWNNIYALQRVTIWATKIDIGESYTIINYNTSQYNFSCGVSSSNDYNESATASNDSGWLTSSTYTITASTTGYLFVQIKTPTGQDIKPSDLLSSDFQIIKGTEPKPYLPYGHIGLVQKGKNTIKISEFSKTAKGITIVSKGNKLILNGTVNSNGEEYLGSVLSDTLNSNYTMKIFTKGSVSGGNYRLYLKGNSQSISVTNVSQVATSNITENIVGISIYLNLGTVFNNYEIEIMLVDGEEEPTLFQPYHEPKTYDIDLAGNSIAKVGDVKDLLSINEKGEVELEKLTGKIVLDGSENWNRYGLFNDFYLYYFDDTSLNGYAADSWDKEFYYGNGLSTHFVWNLSGNYKDSDYVRFQAANGNRLYLGLKKDFPNSTIELKTWLSQNLPEVYYQLTTSQKLTLPTTEPIKMFEGTNIFELIGNLDTTMQIDYYKNYEKYVISNIDF